MAKKYRKKTSSTKKPITLNKVMLILNIVAAVTLLLSYLSPVIDPQDYWEFAILGFGYYILFVLGVLFVLFWVVRRKFYYALISIFSILAGYNVIISNFGFHSKKTVATQKETGAIRLMAYNINTFKGIDKYEGQSIQSKVLDIMKDKQPDIVTFEEFAISKITNDKTIDSIKKILNTNYYYFKPFHISKEELTGDAIFSKFPITDTGFIHSPQLLGTRTAYADIQYNKKVFRLYCIHLAAVQIEQREKTRYLGGSVSVNTSTFVVNKLASAFVSRSYQVSRIKANIDSCHYPYILAGDFNDTPNSFAVNALGEGLKNAFVEKGSGFETTYYSKYPLHIDHILVSPQFNVLNYQSVDIKLSDHKPIISDLKFDQ